ncbi:helix-turn-helix transcriptional regulator [Actinomadura sp. NPDC047616]|uniref:helix-turn-helix transcriptional regulator n=1 Tax=Actinomadura sp. NPDC047616 TaxID=3155914 RepID=UPI0033F4C48D
MTQTRASADGGRRAPGRGARRTDLAAFLRSRRERIGPEDVGMPPGPRRRTPGLRREEVAQLAGVGVTWYTWLEQGRPINASPQVLDAVARTLRLDPAEREHLYALAGVTRRPVAVDPAEGLPEDVPAILDRLDPMPAAVVSARSDIIAWNRAYATLFWCVPRVPPSERNTMWLAFTRPPCCNPIANIEEQAHESVAIFRYRYSRHMDDPGWKEFVQRLCAASPQFARLWATQDVAPPRPCDKVFRHPAVGEIAMRSTGLDLTAAPGLRMIVFNPVGEQDADRVAHLLAHPREAAAALPDHRH